MLGYILRIQNTEFAPSLFPFINTSCMFVWSMVLKGSGKTCVIETIQKYSIIIRVNGNISERLM